MPLSRVYPFKLNVRLNHRWSQMKKKIFLISAYFLDRRQYIPPPRGPEFVPQWNSWSKEKGRATKDFEKPTGLLDMLCEHSGRWRRVVTERNDNDTIRNKNVLATVWT